nr:PLDc N-terminal domain-containing protein [Lapidilactobacillus concavus]
MINMKIGIDYLPFLIPLIILQVGLTAAALIHILRHKTYKHGNRLLWVIASFINIIGPVLYFVFGKEDD